MRSVWIKIPIFKMCLQRVESKSEMYILNESGLQTIGHFISNKQIHSGTQSVQKVTPTRGQKEKIGK